MKTIERIKNISHSKKLKEKKRNAEQENRNLLFIITFLPESIMSIMRLAGLLTRRFLVRLPIRNAKSGNECTKYFLTYSSGNCLGFTPNSLLMKSGLTKSPLQPNAERR